MIILTQIAIWCILAWKSDIWWHRFYKHANELRIWI